MTSATHTTPAALHGLRVLDFGQYIAGPVAAMLLADQGADVIRIDPPGGPRWNTDGNAMWQRGKRRITLDLKDPQDLATARELALRADVLIENFRPGVMERLGLGAAALTEANPQLIYCSLPGFAASDPRAGMPGWEGAIAAATGTWRVRTQVLKTDGGRRQVPPDDGAPNVTILPVASVYAACFAALSVAMALVARQRDGRGQRIEVPLFDATFSAMGSPQWAGIPGAPFVRQYECADGRWICMTGYHGKFNRAFLHEAGVPEWADEPWANLDRPFRTQPEHAQEAIARLEGLFRTRSAQEWEDTLNAAGVPVAICRTAAEWMQLPEALASGALLDVLDPALGLTRQPGIQVRLSTTPGFVQGAARPLDADRAQILKELHTLPRRTQPAGDVPPDPRPPLAGVRVLDLGTVLVGPACGRTLAEFGAEVIKIDDPRGLGPGVDVSRGKLSMLLDLQQAEGRDVLQRLLPNTDVFLQNFRLGVAERMGLGWDALHARHPALVCVSFTLYGREGPWAARPGYEYQAQAATGMQERLGGGPPAIESFAVSDYGTALTGAFGVALALYHREALRQRGETPRGQHVDTSLAFTTSLLQSPFMVDHANKVWDEPRGPHIRGHGTLQRCWRATDGWFFLGAREQDLPAMARLPQLRGLDSLRPVERARWLELQLARRTVCQWCEDFIAAGVAAQPVLSVAQVTADPGVQARGLVLRRPHPDGGEVTTIGPIPRLSRTPLVPGPVLRPSMDAPAILAQAGMQEHLDGLLASKVVVIRPPKAVR